MGYIVDDVIIQVKAEMKKLQARYESLINLTHTQRLAIELCNILDNPVNDWDKPVHKEYMPRRGSFV